MKMIGLTTQKRVFRLMAVVALFAVLVAPLSNVPVALAASNFNKQINYQGKLTDSSGTAVADGSYNMEFNLYTQSSGGSPIWTETRTGGNKVTITSALFSVLLGEVTSLSGVNFNQDLYLSVNIGGTGAPSWDGEMTPRKRFGTVPAAFEADKLDGVDSTQFVFYPAGSFCASCKVAPETFSTSTAGRTMCLPCRVRATLGWAPQVRMLGLLSSAKWWLQTLPPRPRAPPPPSPHSRPRKTSDSLPSPTVTPSIPTLTAF